MKLILYTDGASRGNPGQAGIGAVISNQQGEVLLEIAEYVGEVTNNVAEYTALIRGLEEAVKIGASEVEAMSDSELMVKQINGQYRVKNVGLQPLYVKVMELKMKFKGFSISHIGRGQNKKADELANLGIDQNKKA